MAAVRVTEQVLGYTFVRRDTVYYCEELQLTVATDIAAHSRPWFVTHAACGVMCRSDGLRRNFKTPRFAATAAVRVYRDDIRKSHNRKFFADLTPAQAVVVDRIRRDYPKRWRRIIQDYWERPDRILPDMFGDDERAVLDELRRSHGLRWLLSVRYVR